LYYSFYADSWKGNIQLRGLAEGKFKIVDYVNNNVIETVQSSNPIIYCSFEKYLLIKAVPVK
jgi:alpha-galactosidase